eukprot:scaffold130922_cov46-Attheya_sp.AAC.1
MTLQPLSHIHSHCKACAVIAMAGDSGLFFCRRRPCSIRAASQAFGRGDHPSLDVLSSLDSFVHSHVAPPYVGRLICDFFRKHVPSSPLLKASGVLGLFSFRLILRLRMLGDLPATVCESMCRRHPACSKRA